MAKRKLLLSQALMGFLLDAEARSLSPHTLHRHMDDARAGRDPLTSCPGCTCQLADNPLRRHNRAN